MPAWETTNGRRIWLLAEDEESEFLLIKRACQRVSPAPEMQWARNGEQAVEFLSGKSEFPSLILSDIKMPRLSGFELLAWVRGQPSVAKIPFILLTNSNHPGDRQRGFQLGADEYLVKPAKLADFSVFLQAISDRWPGPPPS